MLPGAEQRPALPGPGAARARPRFPTSARGLPSNLPAAFRGRPLGTGIAFLSVWTSPRGRRSSRAAKAPSGAGWIPCLGSGSCIANRAPAPRSRGWRPLPMTRCSARPGIPPSAAPSRPRSCCSGWPRPSRRSSSSRTGWRRAWQGRRGWCWPSARSSRPRGASSTPWTSSCSPIRRTRPRCAGACASSRAAAARSRSRSRSAPCATRSPRASRAGSEIWSSPRCCARSTPGSATSPCWCAASPAPAAATSPGTFIPWGAAQAGPSRRSPARPASRRAGSSKRSPRRLATRTRPRAPPSACSASTLWSPRCSASCSTGSSSARRPACCALAPRAGWRPRTTTPEPTPSIPRCVRRSGASCCASLPCASGWRASPAS